MYLFICILVWEVDVVGLEMKGKIWLTKASRVRSQVWKVGDKRPGKPPPFSLEAYHLSFSVLFSVTIFCLVHFY
jgi:hypothetical protein